ncbi:MAG TPA: TIGR01777 family oxidoreductase [Saprospiraceae bacterium]|nr:TIGR01777 family oxidoreductase [Saprospiraceae bacterium]
MDQLRGKSVLVAGGTGLVGNRLIHWLLKAGCIIHILSRTKRQNTPNIQYFTWDTDKEIIENEAVLVDHIVNLAGAGIADWRWTKKRKALIVESRVKSLYLLKKALIDTGHLPSSMVSASAIGYYGDRGSEWLSENSHASSGFLGETTKVWEEAAQEVFMHCSRGTVIRIGIVLSTRGGALGKILKSAPLRILPRFGSGNQFYSWIHIDDLCQLFLLSLTHPSYQGIINGVAPQPLNHNDFIKSISDGLPGPFIIAPVPAIALKMVLGEMSAVVLDSARVKSDRLNALGFIYNYPFLTGAIRHLNNAKI